MIIMICSMMIHSVSANTKDYLLPTQVEIGFQISGNMQVEKSMYSRVQSRIYEYWKTRKPVNFQAQLFQYSLAAI